MSRIDELIEKLCPEGIVWKTLGDIGSVRMCKRVFKEDTSSSGDIPFFKIGTFGNTPDSYISDELYNNYKKKYHFPKKGDILISAAGTIGKTVVYDGEPAYFQDSNIVWIDNDEKKVSNKFLLHYYSIVKWQTDTGGTIIRLYNDNLKKTKIPIPPLEIQNEIVDILDKFTYLKAELEAELEARKTQYEHYREQLLNFDEKNVKWKALGEIAFYPKMRISSSKVNEFNYVGVENLLQNRQGKISSSYTPTSGNLIEFMEHDILIGNIRPYLKKIWYSDVSGGTNGDVLVVRVKDEYNELINRKYLYFHLASDTFFDFNMKYAKGAKMPRGDKKAILNYRIPIPPLAEQERIVSILDKFDALVNDISSGLPAEIEARRKQYKYYRNKLLTFKKRSDG